MTSTETILTARPQVAKTLDCARCHSQKLRCVRRVPDSRTCDRCLSAGFDCVARKPQRMDRPVDRNGQSKFTRGHVSPARKQARQDLGLNYGTELGGTDFSMANGLPSNVSTVESEGSGTTAQQGILTGVSQLEDWYLSPSHINGTGVGGLASNGSLGGQGNLPPSDRTTNPLDSHITYGNPTLMSLEDINDMLLNFDDRLDWALQPSASLSGQPSSLANKAQATDSSFDDPIEQLSKLQLELYQCLSVVKAVEKRKRDFMEKIAAKACGQVDVIWAEQLFATTEKFIAALEGYTNRAAATAMDGSNLEEGSMDGHIGRYNKR